jgi:L-lysine exporter family protein LysE/ArgO
MELAALTHGLLTQFGLIVSLGPQNLFVINHSARRRHVLTAVVLCAACDTLLILTASFSGILMSTYSPPETALRLSAALFLVVYGGAAMLRAARPETGIRSSNTADGRFRCIASALAVSLLNPSVYVDTVLVIGGTASLLPGITRVSFTAGAIAASFLWFSAIAWLSSRAAGCLERSWVPRALNAISGVLLGSMGLRMLLE